MLESLVFGWLTKDSQDAFSAKVNAGLEGMTGNKSFPTLAEATAACKPPYQTYLTSMANASQGGTDLISIRNTDRAKLVELLRPLISNINAIANGDVDMLLSTAFPLRKNNRTPIGPLSTPPAPVLTQGPTTGTLKAATKSVYGAALYTARLAKASAPTVYLDTQQGTSIRFMFADLTPGELYNVDINAIGAAGPSDFSDVGTLRVI
jgi:hypothetical protein